MSRWTCNNIQFCARAEVIAFGSLKRVPHVEMAGFLTFDTRILCVTTITAYIIRLPSFSLIRTKMSLKLICELQCTEAEFIRGIIKKVFCYRTLKSKTSFQKATKMSLV